MLRNFLRRHCRIRQPLPPSYPLPFASLQSVPSLSEYVADTLRDVPASVRWLPNEPTSRSAVLPVGKWFPLRLPESSLRFPTDAVPDAVSVPDRPVPFLPAGSSGRCPTSAKYGVHIHFFHFQSGQFPQILTGNLGMTDKKSFHSGAFFLPQLLRCLYGMADRKHGSVQRVPLSRKSFRTRPVGYRLWRRLPPVRKFRQDGLTDGLHMLHLRSQRLNLVRKLLSPRLLFHIPTGFFLQGGNKFSRSVFQASCQA